MNFFHSQNEKDHLKKIEDFLEVYFMPNQANAIYPNPTPTLQPLG